MVHLSSSRDVVAAPVVTRCADESVPARIPMVGWLRYRPAMWDFKEVISDAQTIWWNGPKGALKLITFKR